jgi:hypothetical protein
MKDMLVRLRQRICQLDLARLKTLGSLEALALGCPILLAADLVLVLGLVLALCPFLGMTFHTL